jgi:hypothetical protein
VFWKTLSTSYAAPLGPSTAIEDDLTPGRVGRV